MTGQKQMAFILLNSLNQEGQRVALEAKDRKGRTPLDLAQGIELMAFLERKGVCLH